MVSFEYSKGFPSKSMRLQRGSLRETISNLRKLNTIWLEILRISFECISDFPKILKNLMRNLRTPLGNWRESLQFDDNSNSFSLPMGSLRFPLWILFDLEGNSLKFPKGTINILFKCVAILKGTPFKISRCTIIISLWIIIKLEGIPFNFPRVSSNFSSNALVFCVNHLTHSLHNFTSIWSRNKCT